MNEIIPLSKKEYHQIACLVYDKFGISLGDKKQALVAGRLNKVLRQYGFSTFEEYYKYIISDGSGDGLNTLINRISTNHTYFYRENIHLEYFKENILPVLKEKLRHEQYLRIWSCGCASGEEPYTVAILLREFFGFDLPDWNLAVLGTDISQQALEKAKSGIYSEVNVNRLPINAKRKYFSVCESGFYRIKPVLKHMIMFRRLNLINHKFPFKNKFHTVFCRNVMIYFDLQTRTRLLSKIADVMEKGAYLFIGLSESIGRNNPHFDYIRPGVYRRAG